MDEGFNGNLTQVPKKTHCVADALSSFHMYW